MENFLRERIDFQGIASKTVFAGDAHFYEDATTPAKVRKLLDSSQESEKLRGMKQLLAMMSKGRQIPEFFPDVVKNVEVAKSIEVKKMVYVYLVHYADFDLACREIALLAINSFQKDLAGMNQLIRGLALRVLTSIRVSEITQIQLHAVRRCATDTSPYVRKCAANALPKIFAADPSQLEQLRPILDKLLGDVTTMVLGSAILAFNEICPSALEALHPHYRKLCHLLTDMDEWAQVLVLEVLTRYVREQFTDPTPSGTSDAIQKTQLMRSAAVRVGLRVLGSTALEVATGTGASSSSPSSGDAGVAIEEGDKKDPTAIGTGLSIVRRKKRVVKKAFYSDEEDQSAEEEEVYVTTAAGAEIGGSSAQSGDSSAGMSGLSDARTYDEALDRDHALLLKSSLPLLKSRNSAVVLSVSALHFYASGKGEFTVQPSTGREYRDFERSRPPGASGWGAGSSFSGAAAAAAAMSVPKTATTMQKVGRALVRVLRGSREVQYVVLSAVRTMCTERPDIFAPFVSDFFVRAGDPLFNRLIKLDILVSICESSSLMRILLELQCYMKDLGQPRFCCAAIRAIGRIVDLSLPSLSYSPTIGDGGQRARGYGYTSDRGNNRQNGGELSRQDVILGCMNGIMQLLMLCLTHSDMIVRECVAALRVMIQQCQEHSVPRYPPVIDVEHSSETTKKSGSSSSKKGSKKRAGAAVEERESSRNNNSRQSAESHAYSTQATQVLLQLVKLLLLNKIEDGEARATVVWMVGEYFHDGNIGGSLLQKVIPDVLRILSGGFLDEETPAKAQILNFAVKVSLYLGEGIAEEGEEDAEQYESIDGPGGDEGKDKLRKKNKPSSAASTAVLDEILNKHIESVQGMAMYVLELARYDSDTDLRDRARFMTVMLGMAPTTEEEDEEGVEGGNVRGDSSVGKETGVDEEALSELAEHAKNIMLAPKLPPITFFSPRLGMPSTLSLPPRRPRVGGARAPGGSSVAAGLDEVLHTSRERIREIMEVDEEHFRLGSLSSLVGHRVEGYKALPPWTVTQPDPNVRTDAVIEDAAGGLSASSFGVNAPGSFKAGFGNRRHAAAFGIGGDAVGGGGRRKAGRAGGESGGGDADLQGFYDDDLDEDSPAQGEDRRRRTKQSQRRREESRSESESDSDSSSDSSSESEDDEDEDDSESGSEGSEESESESSEEEEEESDDETESSERSLSVSGSGPHRRSHGIDEGEGGMVASVPSANSDSSSDQSESESDRNSDSDKNSDGEAKNQKGSSWAQQSARMDLSTAVVNDAALLPDYPSLSPTYPTMLSTATAAPKPRMDIAPKPVVSNSSGGGGSRSAEAATVVSKAGSSTTTKGLRKAAASSSASSTSVSSSSTGAVVGKGSVKETSSQVLLDMSSEVSVGSSGVSTNLLMDNTSVHHHSSAGVPSSAVDMTFLSAPSSTTTARGSVVGGASAFSSIDHMFAQQDSGSAGGSLPFGSSSNMPMTGLHSNMLLLENSYPAQGVAPLKQQQQLQQSTALSSSMPYHLNANHGINVNHMNPSAASGPGGGVIGYGGGVVGAGYTPGMEMPHEQSAPKVLLRPELGGGLSVSLRFRHARNNVVLPTSMPGATACVLTIRNMKEGPIRRIRVNFPADLRKSTVPDVPQLAPGATTELPFEMLLIGHAGRAMKVDIRCDQGSYSSPQTAQALQVQDWETMSPYQLLSTVNPQDIQRFLDPATLPSVLRGPVMLPPNTQNPGAQTAQIAKMLSENQRVELEEKLFDAACARLGRGSGGGGSGGLMLSENIASFEVSRVLALQRKILSSHSSDGSAGPEGSTGLQPSFVGTCVQRLFNCTRLQQAYAEQQQQQQLQQLLIGKFVGSVWKNGSQECIYLTASVTDRTALIVRVNCADPVLCSSVADALKKHLLREY